MGEFPSGQRGQTVNLLLIASVVRIHLPPPNKHRNFDTKITVLILVFIRKNQGYFHIFVRNSEPLRLNTAAVILVCEMIAESSGDKSCER